MKNHLNFPVLLLCAIFFSLCSTQKEYDPMTLFSELESNAQPNTLSDKEKANSWQLLFDGKNGKGWHGYNMKTVPDCWIIEDGAFTITTTGSAESQDIITDKVYTKFAFSIEYKLTKAANSGIIYQVEENAKYKFPYETGPEFQIIDHENWPDSLQDWQINGANYAMYPPKVKPYKPLGEWNHLLLVVNGNHVTQILNGQIVVEYNKNSEEWEKLRNSGKWANFPDYGKYDAGNITLQNHGTKVSFRSIKIKELYN